MLTSAPRARCSLSPLESLLRQCYNKPACAPSLHGRSSRIQLSRTLHYRVADELKDVAIIGGGITGLATAYYLSKAAPPHTRITLLESGDRLGGWVHSEEVDVGNGQKVLFEKGPRSLRPTDPNGLLTLELVSYLWRRCIYEPLCGRYADKRLFTYP